MTESEDVVVGGTAAAARGTRTAGAVLLGALVLFAATAAVAVDAVTEASASEGVLHVVYPRPESSADTRVNYPIAVLRLALERSGQRFSLAASPAVMPQARSLRLLAEGREVDVVWSLADKARDATLHRIPRPIDRGLLGWRLLMVARGQSQHFASVTSVHDLSRFVAGQGHDWPDVRILRAAGLPVETGTNYEGLFAMLERGRFDYFPRALSEAFPEIEAHPSRKLEIEPGLLLHYPAALYFFVGREATVLAHAIEAGLDAAHQSGSLGALFDRHFGADIARARLHERRTLELPNPDVAALQKEVPSEWWFTPAEAP